MTNETEHLFHKLYGHLDYLFYKMGIQSCLFLTDV